MEEKLNIFNPVPKNFTMAFCHRNKIVGTIKINENLEMEFSGNLGKSAVMFMNFIKPYIEDWIKKKGLKKTWN